MNQIANQIRFIRTLKKRSYKYMTSILDGIVNKQNNTYYKTIKTKLVDVKSKTFIDFSKEANNKDPKFKIGDIVRIYKYENIFGKGYTPN